VWLFSQFGMGVQIKKVATVMIDSCYMTEVMKPRKTIQ